MSNEHVSKAEYARLKGWNRSTVTRAADAGRLVLTGDGKVDVAASDARYAETADPGRADVAQRHAAGRAGDDFARIDQQPKRQQQQEDHAPAPDKIGNSYQAARAVKEKYAAMEAKRLYEVNIGKLVEKSDVINIVADVVIGFRQSLENLPHAIAPQIIGKDQDAIRAMIKEEINIRLNDMEKRFSYELSELGDDPA